MRELKFRAWDKDEKRWLKCDELYEMSFNPVLDKYGNGFNLNDTTHQKTNRTVEFVQYTGLKDSNQREIWEGDIVSFTDDRGMGAPPEKFEDEVRFEGGCFYPICERPSTEYTVVGNIYENWVGKIA